MIRLPIPDPVSSRIPGFHKLTLRERLARLQEIADLSGADVDALRGNDPGTLEIADRMIENAIGVMALPMGVGLNLTVNGRDYVVPMAIEEPSVIAAVSFASKLVRQAGGFVADADESLMIGQVQVAHYGDPEVARAKILEAKPELLALANSFQPRMVERGGGTRDLEVRVLPAPEGPQGEPLLIVHFIIDTLDAMGANLINTTVEGVAPRIEALTGGKVYLRILSNLADRRLTRASCRIPFSLFADFDMNAQDIVEGICQASRFAEADPYRATTHNKGIMNGIDAAAVATGQDWRALEAGAHAFACRDGRYRPLSTWKRDGDALKGEIELPLALGIVGRPTQVHPAARAGLRLLGARTAREMSMVLASVGLAQNLAAVRALGSVGIQRGHMALHDRMTRTGSNEP